MTHTIRNQASPARMWKWFAPAIVFAAAIGTASPAAAQRIDSPDTPSDITPPRGSVAFLLGRAAGTQGYVCLPKDAGASWTVNGARPEATLFSQFFGIDFQIITHFLSPNTSPNKYAPDPLPFGNATWQSSFDSSRVWAQAVGSIPSGTHPSCPNDPSIACLLLQVVGAEEGPSGGKSLTRTSYIQRLNTAGGVAPSEGCSVPGDVGKQKLVPYTADYYFFRGPE